MPDLDKPNEHEPVADVEVSSVTPERAGFTLDGLGADRADYRMRLELEVPLDARTRSVLGEMLSQCRVRVWRRVAAPRTGHLRAGAGRAGGKGLHQNEP